MTIKSCLIFLLGNDGVGKEPPWAIFEMRMKGCILLRMILVFKDDCMPAWSRLVFERDGEPGEPDTVKGCWDAQHGLEKAPA